MYTIGLGADECFNKTHVTSASPSDINQLTEGFDSASSVGLGETTQI
jgi:hypothetical protein